MAHQLECEKKMKDFYVNDSNMIVVDVVERSVVYQRTTT